MKKIEKRLKQIIREMTKNACDDIGYPYDETCTETILYDLQYEYNIFITDNTKIDYRLMSHIAECVEKFAIATEFNCSDIIIEHYLQQQQNNK